MTGITPRNKEITQRKIADTVVETKKMGTSVLSFSLSLDKNAPAKEITTTKKGVKFKFKDKVYYLPKEAIGKILEEVKNEKHFSTAFEGKKSIEQQFTKVVEISDKRNRWFKELAKANTQGDGELFKVASNIKVILPELLKDTDFVEKTKLLNMNIAKYFEPTKKLIIPD